MRAFVLVIVTLVLFGAAGAMTTAQETQPSCPALVQQALDSVGGNCGDLARNSACYGYDDVLATFEAGTDAVTFQAPSDRAGLTTLASLGTSPMDVTLEKWGIALMSLQANLPETLPGQNTVFMLLGNTQVENAVAPEDAFAGGTVVNVLTRSAAGLFAESDSASDVVSAVPGNVDLQADARTANGEWVRVAYNGVPGWVTRNVLEDKPEIETLPVLTADTFTPMQAFYLRTNITGTDCTEAPDSLVVQGPENLKVSIRANGADIQLGSTIGLRVLGSSSELQSLFAPYYAEIGMVTRFLELFVLDGEAVLYPGTPQELHIPAGYRTYICLSETDNLGMDTVDNDREVIDGCPWLPPMPWTPIDFETFQLLDGVTLNYTITLPDSNVPTLTPTATVTPTPTNTRPVVYVPPTNTPTPSVTATVIPFDTLTATPTTPRATDTPTPTETYESEGNYTEEPVPYYTDTATMTVTPTDTLTNTATATVTDTLTATATATPTDTATTFVD